MTNHTTDIQHRKVSLHSRPWTSLWNINTGALILAALWFGVIISQMSPAVDDFSFHWRAARSMLATGNPYAGQTALQLERSPYVYPPLFAFLAQPIGLLSQSQAQWIWFGISALALALLLWLCISVSGSRLARQYWGVFVLGALLSPPVRISLQLGQISIFLALLMIGSYVLARRHAAGAGFCLSVAALTKLFPGLLLLYFLLNRSWRVLWWSCVAGIILLLLPLLVYGTVPYFAFMQMLLVDGKDRYAAEFNVSILGFVQRLFTKNQYAVPLADVPRVAQLVQVTLSLGVLGTCLWAGRGLKGNFGTLLNFNLWLVGMMLLNPLNGYYNLVFLILPLLTLIRYLEWFADRNMRNGLILATIFAWVPSAWSDGNQQLYTLMHGRWGNVILAPPFYAVIMYLILLAVAAGRYRAYRSIE